MDIFRAIVLGVVEGLTEFLPVSSTGHMILAAPWLGVDLEEPRWAVFLFLSQLGAILAVVAYFWRELLAQLLTPPTGGWYNHLAAKLLIAFIPAVVLGLLFNDVMERYLEKPVPVALALIAGAGAIEWIDRRFRRGGDMTIENVSPVQAALIGLAQCVSMWPGVSRAGATIMGGMMAGLTPRVATEFSFYLAIPTLCSAGLYRLYKHRESLNGGDGAILLLGASAAFVTALLVIDQFMRFVQRQRFRVFVWWRVVLGVVVLAYYSATA